MDPLNHNNHRRHRDHLRRHHNPSFSSTLLDQIYRSFDDSSTPTTSVVSMKKTKTHTPDKIIVNRREIAEDFVRSRHSKPLEPVFFKNSSSSSSDSSGFSSSTESDSFYRRNRSSRRSPPSIPLPKPIRTTVDRFERSPQIHTAAEHGSFLRTKSKALKFYSDLKKVKQPISPGGRLAAFLNSIFTGGGNGNTKKPNKINTTTVTTAATAASSTACSTASSFSRSCLSKTTSSSEKSKRSVRFCPVNVVKDDVSKRNNKLYGNDKEENRRVIEAAKELLRTFHNSKNAAGEEEEEDDDDDVASCASSDLFELDNLSAIGIQRYREELPVYETTRFNNNHYN
ncbi:unnamed protein product [Cochlearia groenlandica]